MKIHGVKFLIFILSGILCFFSVSEMEAAVTYPSKPIRLIVTSSAGGGEDVEARGIAPYLEKHLGVRIFVEDQPGAGGKIAFERFQKTAPDGYTLITYSFPKNIIMEYMTKTNYRSRDFTPILIWSRVDTFISVHADTWKTFGEFIKAAQSRTLSAAIPGKGGINHVTGLMLIDKLGIKVTWVPYEAGAAGYAALAGKHIDVAFGSSTGLVGLVDAGKLRILTCLSDKRNPYLPDIPTPRELGVDVSAILQLRGVEAPPNTPPAIAKVLEEAFSKAVKEPGFIDWAKKNKVVLTPMGSKEFHSVKEDTHLKVEKFQNMLKEE